MPYPKVDTSIKVSNREMASETVKTLMAYGYSLEPPSTESDEGECGCWCLSSSLEPPSTESDEGECGSGCGCGCFTSGRSRPSTVALAGTHIKCIERQCLIFIDDLRRFFCSAGQGVW